MNAPTTALITGGAQGIGAKAAHTLASRGWRIIVADLNEGPAKDLAEELNRQYPVGSAHLGFGVDVADEVSVDSLHAAVADETALIDGLVNCAGNILRQPAEELDIAQWRRLLDIHLTGSMLMAKTFYPMLRAARGSIVNIGSVGSTLGLPGRTAYATAKTGAATASASMQWRLDTSTPRWSAVACETERLVKRPSSGALPWAGSRNPRKSPRSSRSSCPPTHPLSMGS
jgi:NAD(P)-dependent dehydrogenase (short-subunit alcohol dehydrogenase family)